MRDFISFACARCRVPQSRIAAITGTKLRPLRVRRYSTLGGTTPKSLRSISPVSVSDFNSRLSTRGAISEVPLDPRSRPVRISP
jgi:hypothetical protein